MWRRKKDEKFYRSQGCDAGKEDGIAKFPDAPSERAVKHVEELISARKEGYEAVVCFVIQMKQVRFLTPNVKTHPEFSDAFWARESGVELIALDCTVKKDSITAGKRIPVILPESRLEQSVSPLIHWFRQHNADASVARKSHCLSCLGIRNYVAADKGRGSKAVLC